LNNVIPLGNGLLLRSPTLVNRTLKSHKRFIHNIQKKERFNRDTIARLQATEEVIPNVNVDALLGSEKQWKKEYEAMMSRETDISKKEIFSILFQEMDVVRKRKLRDGDARGHNWSPLMIQFCGHIRQGNGPSSGMNASTWDFISQVFHLPTNNSLMKYVHTDTSTPNGLSFETVVQNAKHIDKLEESLQSPIRYGKLSVDSHTVKEQFCKYVSSLCALNKNHAKTSIYFQHTTPTPMQSLALPMMSLIPTSFAKNLTH
jgi:hypothetical protein